MQGAKVAINEALTDPCFRRSARKPAQTGQDRQANLRSRLANAKARQTARPSPLEADGQDTAGGRSTSGQVAFSDVLPDEEGWFTVSSVSKLTVRKEAKWKIDAKRTVCITLKLVTTMGEAVVELPTEVTLRPEVVKKMSRHESDEWCLLGLDYTSNRLFVLLAFRGPPSVRQQTGGHCHRLQVTFGNSQAGNVNLCQGLLKSTIPAMDSRIV